MDEIEGVLLGKETLTMSVMLCGGAVVFLSLTVTSSTVGKGETLQIEELELVVGIFGYSRAVEGVFLGVIDGVALTCYNCNLKRSLIFAVDRDKLKSPCVEQQVCLHVWSVAWNIEIGVREQCRNLPLLGDA